MSDWIDSFFDEIKQKTKVHDSRRSELEKLTDSALICPERERWLRMEIQSDHLTMTRSTEILRFLLSNQMDILDQYAPSERQLAKRIRQFI